MISMSFFLFLFFIFIFSGFNGSVIFLFFPARFSYWKNFFFFLWILLITLDIFFVGPLTFTTECRLIAPGFALKGTLSITSNDLYFDADEEDPEFQSMDIEVSSHRDGMCGGLPCLSMLDTVQWCVVMSPPVMFTVIFESLVVRFAGGQQWVEEIGAADNKSTNMARGNCVCRRQFWMWWWWWWSSQNAW